MRASLPPARTCHVTDSCSSCPSGRRRAQCQWVRVDGSAEVPGGQVLPFGFSDLAQTAGHWGGKVRFISSHHWTFRMGTRCAQPQGLPLEALAIADFATHSASCPVLSTLHLWASVFDDKHHVSVVDSKSVLWQARPGAHGNCITPRPRG